MGSALEVLETAGLVITVAPKIILKLLPVKFLVVGVN